MNKVKLTGDIQSKDELSAILHNEGLAVAFYSHCFLTLLNHKGYINHTSPLMLYKSYYGINGLW